MRITVLATGSRGDVQPFVAIGLGLQQAGHQVSIAANAHFEPWVRGYGLEFRPISWDAEATLQTEQAQRMIQSGRIFDLIKYFLQVTPRFLTQLQVESWQVCQDSDALFYSLLSFWGHAIAEKLNIPGVPGFLHPMIPTRSFPTQMLPLNLGGPLNLMSHYLAEQAFWQAFRIPANAFRQKTLGLTPLRFPETLFSLWRKQEIPLLYSLSPTIISRSPDWPPNVHVNGYWFLPAPPGWQPPADLVDFIQRGLPPIYVGFGSMTNQRAEETTRLVLEALKLSGQRGVLAGGWGSLSAADFSDNVFFLAEAPHEWLFPHMAVVVHHGGAGTTAAGLWAGVPAVVIPHMQDQPYWGQQLYKLGIGPKPVPISKLTAENLAQSIILAVQHDTFREQARQIGQKIRAEEGVTQTIKIFEHYVHLKL